MTTSRTHAGFHLRRRAKLKSQHAEAAQAEVNAWEKTHQQARLEARATRKETTILSAREPDRPGTVQELRGLLLKACGRL